MSLRTVTWLALATLLFSGVARAETVIHTNMAGNTSCAAYLKARSEGKSLAFQLWLSGYLTGLATYDRRINNVSRLEKANGEEGALLLDSYCKVHPMETFQIASREMARTLFYGTGSR